MSDAEELRPGEFLDIERQLAVTESDSGGRVYRLCDGLALDPPNPARDVYPVYPPWLSESAGAAAAHEGSISERDRP